MWEDEVWEGGFAENRAEHSRPYRYRDCQKYNWIVRRDEHLNIKNEVAKRKKVGESEQKFYSTYTV